jgi:hypothetical protein
VKQIVERFRTSLLSMKIRFSSTPARQLLRHTIPLSTNRCMNHYSRKTFPVSILEKESSTQKDSGGNGYSYMRIERSNHIGRVTPPKRRERGRRYGRWLRF